MTSSNRDPGPDFASYLSAYARLDLGKERLDVVHPVLLSFASVIAELDTLDLGTSRPVGGFDARWR